LRVRARAEAAQSQKFRTSLGMNPLSVAFECLDGELCECLIVRHDLGSHHVDQLIEVADAIGTAPRKDDLSGFVIADGADHASVGIRDGFEERAALPVRAPGWRSMPNYR
jgi:hypothetical protein